jgi:predicted alpha/beta superfamily hydrolase
MSNSRLNWDDIFSLEAMKKKDWVGKVETKVEFGEGFFKDNTAEQIASAMKKKHSGDINKAISALNYQINRNKNQSEAIKSKIRKAIKLLQAERDRNKASKK